MPPDKPDVFDSEDACPTRTHAAPEETGSSPGSLASDRVEPRALFASRYVLGPRLGRGGSGTVYEAHDTKLGIDLALKVLDGGVALASAARLRREVRAAREVAHENLVRIFDVGEEDGRGFLTMELLRGGSLGEMIVRRGKLEPGEAREIVSRVASALAALHARGIVHRDVKPGNILFDEAGTPKLCDLGLVRFASAETITVDATGLGTPEYLSPEQANGSQITPASDVYSLGLVLFEMLTGARPFVAETPLATALLRIQREVDLGEVPDSRDKRLLERMLERDPARRLQDGNAVLRSIEAGRRLYVPRRVRRGLLTGAVVVPAAICGALALRAWFRARPAEARVVDNGAVLVDRAGRELKRFTTETPVRRSIRADLDGDGKDELLIGTACDSERQRPGRFFVLGPGLEVLISPEGGFRNGQFNAFAPTYDVLPERPHDPDGRGKLLPVVNAHVPWYPSILRLFRLGSSEQVFEMRHSGQFIKLCWGNVDGRPGEELVFLAINNRLGHQTYVGAVSLEPGIQVESPDYNESDHSGLLWYTPADVTTQVQSGSIDLEIDRMRKRIVVKQGGKESTWLTFDGARLGNPGSIGRPELYRTIRGSEMALEAGDVTEARRRMDGFSKTVREPLLSVAALRVRKETLLREGRYREAAEELRTAASSRSGSGSFRLGAAEALALGGRLTEAIDECRRVASVQSPVWLDACWREADFRWLAGGSKGDIESVAARATMGPARSETWMGDSIRASIEYQSAHHAAAIRLARRDRKSRIDSERLDRAEVAALAELDPRAADIDAVLGRIRDARGEDNTDFVELSAWHAFKLGDAKAARTSLARLFDSTRDRSTYSVDDLLRLPTLAWRYATVLENLGERDLAKKVRAVQHRFKCRAFYMPRKMD